MVAVGVTEWGHALALICLGAALPLASPSWSGRVAVGLSVSAALLALTPVFRAISAARNVTAGVVKAFGDNKGTQPAPLIFTKLFLGMSPPEVIPRTLEYGGKDEKLSMDFYRGEGTAPSPLIVAIHGGSWNSGDNKDFIAMDQFLAGRGFAVADVLYRLAPRFRFPAASSDILAAIRFLTDRADSLKIDPTRIVLLGRSAGGQIALQVAYSAGNPAIRGVISFYAPIDLEWSWEHPGNPRIIDTRAVLTDYLGGGPAEFAANYAAASPIRLVSSTCPPTLLFHGGRDEFVSGRHNALLSQRLTESGVPNLNVSLPWATHGFDYILRGPGGQISTFAVEAFLGKVLR
jgi:acetyl esterase/lipase